jgi:hypothetical protein
MVKTYLKLSLRQIGRNRIFSTINILGLGFSIGVCLIAVALLSIIGQTYRAASVNPADKLRNG